MQEILAHCVDLPKENFEVGTVLIEQGDSLGRLMILESGSLEVLRDGVPIASIAEPGAIIGEMSALLSSPYTATVRAVEPTTVRVTSNAGQFLESHSMIALAVARTLAQRLNAATTYLVDLKQQYQGYGDHLGMVSEVLDALIHCQDEEVTTGSDRAPDPMM